MTRVWHNRHPDGAERGVPDAAFESDDPLRDEVIAQIAYIFRFANGSTFNGAFLAGT
jgi:hypothetical protein